MAPGGGRASKDDLERRRSAHVHLGRRASSQSSRRRSLLSCSRVPGVPHSPVSIERRHHRPRLGGRRRGARLAAHRTTVSAPLLMSLARFGVQRPQRRPPARRERRGDPPSPSGRGRPRGAKRTRRVGDLVAVAASSCSGEESRRCLFTSHGGPHQSRRSARLLLRAGGVRKACRLTPSANVAAGRVGDRERVVRSSDVRQRSGARDLDFSYRGRSAEPVGVRSSSVARRRVLAAGGCCSSWKRTRRARRPRTRWTTARRTRWLRVRHAALKQRKRRPAMPCPSKDEYDLPVELEGRARRPGLRRALKLKERSAERERRSSFGKVPLAACAVSSPGVDLERDAEWPPREQPRATARSR